MELGAALYGRPTGGLKRAASDLTHLMTRA